MDGHAAVVSFVRINEEYMVLTDGTWSIHTDYDEQTDALRALPAAQGVESDVAAYCG